MSRHPAAKHPRPMRKPVSRTPAWLTPVAVVAAVTLLLAGFLLVRWYTTPVAIPPLNTDAAQVVVTTLASLPAAELDSIGQGSAHNVIKAVSGDPLTGPTGKQLMFYFGAEYCPYCAAERWPMIVALSRFGAFSGLKTTTSSSSDAYPNTPTFTFHGATFTSRYIDFQAVETSDRNQNRLETATASQQALVNQYDTSGSIPFVDIGNRYVFAGAMYLPDVLSGMSWQAIADSLAQPDTPQAKAVLGSANLITAALCRVTLGQPAGVCTSASIQAIDKQLG
jgi:thiol-disulfide isomerase/thioredoxin